MSIIDVNRLEAQPREDPDNKHIVRRDDLKISLVSVRPNEEIPIHLHEEGEQFYYVLAHLPHGVQNSTATPLGILTFLWPEALDLCL